MVRTDKGTSRTGAKRLRNDGIIRHMGTRDSLETDTRVIDAPDVTCEAAEPPRGEVLDDPKRRREESAESQQRADGQGESGPFKVDRSELGRFDLRCAGLPDMSIE